MRIGGRDFDTENGVYIMGILNLTPDSFSDGGRWTERDAALRQAARMASEGAAIIDLAASPRARATRRSARRRRRSGSCPWWRP